MGMNSWITAKQGTFESAEVFATPPHRSRQFLACTILVIISIALACSMLIVDHQRITWLACIWIALMAVTVLLNWCRTLNVHRKLHDRYFFDSERQPLPEIEMALRGASTLSYWGTCATAAAAIAGLGAILQLVLRT